ncbi:MAG: YdcF family protein [Wenzhouxiangella sp.]
MTRFLTFLLGLFTGLTLLTGVTTLSLPHLADWLVVDSEPVRADTIVVLGGGDGSRVRKAVGLSEGEQFQPILLVDNKKSHWNHIARNLCDEGTFEGKRVECLIGSTSTVTDAQITLDYCHQRGIKKVLVVTDPYHSRRAQVIFTRVYKDSGIETSVVHSGYYGNRLPPDQGWWQDELTLQTVWVEFGKIVYFELSPILKWWQHARS